MRQVRLAIDGTPAIQQEHGDCPLRPCGLTTIIVRDYTHHRRDADDTTDYSNPMIITLKLFAILKDRAGVSQTTLELPTGNTVADAARSLSDRYPAIEPFLAKIAYAVNESYVHSDIELRDGDELALIPPVSGG